MKAQNGDSVLNQRLDDHINNQISDFNDLKTLMIRIENKLDLKANKEDLKILDGRVWLALVSSFGTMLSIIANIIIYKK
jgi:hypothetical protein